MFIYKTLKLRNKLFKMITYMFICVFVFCFVKFPYFSQLSLPFFFFFREIIFVLLEMLDTYIHTLFLELKELKKYDVIIKRL